MDLQELLDFIKGKLGNDSVRIFPIIVNNADTAICRVYDYKEEPVIIECSIIKDILDVYEKTETK